MAIIPEHPSETKIRNLHPSARRRASAPLSYAEFPPPPPRAVHVLNLASANEPDESDSQPILKAKIARDKITTLHLPFAKNIMLFNFESRLVSSKFLRSYSSKFVSGDWEQYRTVYCESIEVAEEKLDI